MKDFDTALEELKLAICASYNGWYGRVNDNAGNAPDKEPHNGWWTPERITFKKSSGKYSKVFTPDHGDRQQIWGFIVTDQNHPKFKYGDLLKAATYKAPATNHARGNLFTGYSGVEWTGPTYCGTDAQKENEARAEMQDPLEILKAI